MKTTYPNQLDYTEAGVDLSRKFVFGQLIFCSANKKRVEKSPSRARERARNFLFYQRKNGDFSLRTRFFWPFFSPFSLFLSQNSDSREVAMGVFVHRIALNKKVPELFVSFMLPSEIQKNGFSCQRRSKNQKKGELLHPNQESALEQAPDHKTAGKSAFFLQCKTFCLCMGQRSGFVIPVLCSSSRFLEHRNILDSTISSIVHRFSSEHRS